MKLKNFKKAIHRAGHYKHCCPRINQKILVNDDGFFAYYTCHNLNGRWCYDTGEFFYIIKKKRKRHE